MNKFKENFTTAIDKRSAAKNSTLVSVVINIILSITQIVTGFLASSQSLIADGFHSLSDLLADFVVLIANHHSHKDADDDHHYGHQRFENAASLFLGVSLLAVGIAILWSAGVKIIFPTTTKTVQIVALWVAITTLISKEILFRYLLQVAKKTKSSMLIANAWHARSDAASSLVVVVGIIGALIGYKIFDTIGALIVGLIIAKTGWDFAWQALHDLMDGAISEDENKKIITIVKDTSGVIDCHDLRTRKMGDMIMMDIHIEVDGKITVKESYDIVLAVKNNIMTQMPVLDVMVHVDPA
ncbi:MAG: cation diffusion facilitator family transporter [Rickettsiales bacterium]|nr:cation diffusion facilitator family transporter [Rickettsiales bacterium]